MRELATLLNGQARVLGAQAGALVSPVDRMTFEGPAASAFRGRMTLWQTAMLGEISRLQGLASRLMTAADEVERQQEAAARRMERILEGGVQTP
jgi:hypothetical protein